MLNYPARSLRKNLRAQAKQGHQIFFTELDISYFKKNIKVIFMRKIRILLDFLTPNSQFSIMSIFSYFVVPEVGSESFIYHKLYSIRDS